MADPYNDAQKRIEAQRQALLADMAKRGSQAKADHDAATAAAAAQRQEAIKATLADAARRNAPEGLMGQLSATVATPYDRQAADSARANETRAANLRVAQSANNDYLSQVASAIPISREISARQKAERDSQQALERELANIRLTEARESRDFAREEREWERRQRELAGVAGEDLSDSELEKRLLGAARYAQGSAAAAGVPRDTSPQSRGQTVAGLLQLGVRPGVGQAVHDRSLTEEALARELGERAGVDPARVYGVVTDPKPKEKAEKPASDSAVKQTAYYRAIANDIVAGIDAGKSEEAIIRAIQQEYGKRYPRSVALALAEFFTPRRNDVR